MYNILVLGGYGIFGQRIVQRLARFNHVQVIIAGRDIDKARNLADAITQRGEATQIYVAECDAQDPDSLTRVMQEKQCHLVINTCGPFQQQNYTCPTTVIRNRAHYIDLADARDYVCGFHALDALAKQYGALAITGASSVPALSSAVIDNLAAELTRVDTIDVGINPGNQTPRGIATVRSILSYCGKPFLVWHQGKWQTITGWQNLSRRQYPAPMGKRWLSNCDIPDLTLFRERYPQARTIRFQAGLQLSVLHLGTWLLSWPVRWGWIQNGADHAHGLKKISEWFYRFGSTIGGMHVEVTGIDQQSRLVKKTWNLIASDGDGPQVPCTAAVLLAQKLMAGTIRDPGAGAGTGFIDLREFETELKKFAIRTSIEEKPLSRSASSATGTAIPLKPQIYRR